MKHRKLIYVLNHYSAESAEHFSHILRLLESIAAEGVQVALVIEKSSCVPETPHENLRIICQAERRGLRRARELFGILRGLMREGYRKVFVRISVNAALVAVLAARRYGAETYYWQSGTTHVMNKSVRGARKLRWLLVERPKSWLVQSMVDHFVTGPESMIEYYAGVVGVRRTKLMLLYNDIDISRFKPASGSERKDARESLGVAGDTTIVLMVHRLSPVRRTDFYIPFVVDPKTFDDHNAHLVIVGDGPERSVLEALISAHPANGRIHLLGSRPNRDIDAFYRAADLFVNPSYTEGFPRVVIEAMAAGLPVVATDAGGTRDIFGPLQQAYVVPADDREAFRALLSELLGNADARATLRVENLERVSRYSTEAVARMYADRIFADG